MNEGDSLALGARARDFVNQPCPRIPAAFQSRVQIVHRKADVMNRRATPGDKSADWRVRLCRLQQLDNRSPRIQSRYPRAVGVLQIDGRQPQDFPVERQNLGDGAHGNPDVSNSRALRG